MGHLINMNLSAFRMWIIKKIRFDSEFSLESWPVLKHSKKTTIFENCKMFVIFTCIYRGVYWHRQLTAVEIHCPILQSPIQRIVAGKHLDDFDTSVDLYVEERAVLKEFHESALYICKMAK